MGGQPLEIYTTRPEGPESTPIGVKNANLFSISPSGELAISLRDRFLGGPSGFGTLATVPLGGGAPRPIAETIESADWTADGKQLALVRFLEGKNRIELPLGKVLFTSDRGLGSIRVAPQGGRVAFLPFLGQRGRALTVVDAAGKSTALVPPPLRGQGFAWSPSGEEIWFDDVGERGTFLLKAVDLAGRVRVVGTFPAGLIVHDISRDGRVLAERYGAQPAIVGLLAGQKEERNLSWFDRSVLSGLSDDGTMILINETGDAAGAEGAYYVRKTDGSPAVKLGEGQGFALSGDGRWVIAQPPSSNGALLLVPTGTGAPIPIPPTDLEAMGNGELSPDGKRLIFGAAEKGGKRRVYIRDLPAGKPRPISDRAYGLPRGGISPDGRWAVAWGEWTEDLFLLPTDGGEARNVANTKDLDFVRWSGDGKFIFGAVAGSIPAQAVRVEIATGKRENWKELAPSDRSGLISIGPIFLTPDGAGYVYGYGRASTSDLYLIEGLK